jgi:hypothetical protein
MKNITQPLVVAPTLANLQMLVSLDRTGSFLQQISCRIGFNQELLTRS